MTHQCEYCETNQTTGDKHRPNTCANCGAPLPADFMSSNDPVKTTKVMDIYGNFYWIDQYGNFAGMAT